MESRRPGREISRERNGPRGAAAINFLLLQAKHQEWDKRVPGMAAVHRTGRAVLTTRVSPSWLRYFTLLSFKATNSYVEFLQLHVRAIILTSWSCPWVRRARAPRPTRRRGRAVPAAKAARCGVAPSGVGRSH